MTTPSRRIQISLVVPCFNHSEFLREAVASVKSTAREDIELIVVDDGSTDARTPLVLDRLAAEAVHVIRQENKGVAAARNNAIFASQGEYIFPLDADDRLRPGWIDNAIRILNAKPKVGIVYGDAEFFGARNGRWRVGSFDLERLLFRNYIPVSALYRRSVWEQNGGYDGSMPVQGFEDWDFWLSAVERGWDFVYSPELFFDYRQAAESMLTRAFASEAQVQEFIARKHGLLYRRAWLPYLNERLSIKLACQHLGRLLIFRMNNKFHRGTEGSSQRTMDRWKKDDSEAI